MDGKQLSQRRGALGMTQKQLADKLGAHSNTLAKWERDEGFCQYPGMLDLALTALEREHALAIEPVLDLLEQQIEKLQATRDTLAAKRGKKSRK